jgi:hypothetical protein
MKYDDAEYCFLNFETDLPTEAGGTHTGMYLAWAASKGLLGDGFEESTLAPLLARTITGCQLYFDQCDGKLTDDDFSDEGNAFTASYYEQHFVADYRRVFKDDLPNGGESTDEFCSLPDTWENYDRLAPVLDQRYARWQEASAPGAAPAAAPLALVEEPSEALDRLRDRAEGGDNDAWFELGVEYITGQRVPQDMKAAADAFTRGAERGSVDCQFNLGVCFQHGDGRTKDEARALHWFSQAANGGHAEATLQLALAYRSGRGVPQDEVAANALVMVAQAKGSQDARKAGITAGSLLEATALLEQLRQPGQLLLVLARRRAKPAAAAGAGGGASSRAPVADARKAQAGTGRVGAPAVVALLVGAASFILLLLATSFAKGAALQLVAVLLGAVAAFGAYRCSLGLGKSSASAAMLGALAFVPVLGSFVCLWLVLQVVRSGRPG